MDNWNRYEAKLELTKKLLKHALSTNRLRYFMTGTTPYCIENKDDDTYFMLKALYAVNQEQPELMLAERFDEEMILICSNCVHEGILESTIQIILCQLTAQKENTAGFTVDCDRYIACLRELVQIIKKKYDTSQGSKMLSMLRNYNMVLMNNFGKCFM